MVEIVKWAGLFFLAIMIFGAFKSTPPKIPTDLPNSKLFWVGLFGCILSLVIYHLQGGEFLFFG